MVSIAPIAWRDGGVHIDAQVDQQASPSRALAEFVAGLRYEDIPPPVRELAKLLILDALGCGLAATGYDFTKATLSGAQALGGDGPCAVIGSAVRLPLRDAALVNGVLLHGLDFDDSNFLGILHPTVACLRHSALARCAAPAGATH
jgi:2-methylcitrate dehydratase PrpD